MKIKIFLFFYKKAVKKHGQKLFRVAGKGVFAAAQAPVAYNRALAQGVRLDDFIERNVASDFARVLPLGNDFADEFVVICEE